MLFGWVVKVLVGVLMYVWFIFVVNIVRVVIELKVVNIWVVGFEVDGEDFYDGFDLI